MSDSTTEPVKFNGVFWISPWTSKHILSIRYSTLYATHIIYTSNPYSGIAVVVALPNKGGPDMSGGGPYRLAGEILVDEATRIHILYAEPRSVLSLGGPPPTLNDYAGNITLWGIGVVDGIESVPMPFDEESEIICRLIRFIPIGSGARITYSVKEHVFHGVLKSQLICGNKLELQGRLNGYNANEDYWIVEVDSIAVPEGLN